MVPEVTAALRPRSGWESQDLGIAMVRGRLGRLLWQWCVVWVPFWVLLGLALHSHPWAFFWLTWWLKPLYDRVPLFALSRRLFGQETRLRDVLKELPKLCFKGNWYFLTVGRLSFYRCFSMPVKVLEGGTHSTYRRRVSVLLRQGDSTVFWVTLGWLLCSICTIVGCWELMDSLIVNQEATEDAPMFTHFFGNSWYHAEASTVWTLSVLHLIAITLTEIFYMGAGFGLYLNSRSHLEGWDIEVRFRSLAARLAESVTKTAIVILTLLLISAPPAQAITKPRPTPQVEHETVPINKRSVENTVQDVKKNEDFKIHSEEHTVYDDVSGPKSSWNLDWNFDGLGAIIYLLGYAGIAALIIFLGAILFKYRHVFIVKGGPSEASTEPTRARVVMGLDVSPESLPSDVPAAAAQLWRAGDIRGALRLLYAGSLHWMIDRARLPIRESDTEGDCLRHSRQLTDQLQTSYFQSLTQIWMGHAYGHRAPASAEMEQCINQWPFRK